MQNLAFQKFLTSTCEDQSETIFNDGGEIGLPNAFFDPAAAQYTTYYLVNREFAEPSG